VSYDIDPGYTVDWGTNSWRMPTAVDGPFAFSHDGTATEGFNITNSEMGHLYYTELSNPGRYAIDGTENQGDWVNNTGDFENLDFSESYWSGTEYDGDTAWFFDMLDGYQATELKYTSHSALLLRNGQVSMAPVPEPTTMLLFSLGILSLAGVSRKKK
jgi:hypothetical protein